MKLSVKLLSCLLLLVVVCSCRKNKPDVDPPNPPDDSLIVYPLAPPPSSIVFESRHGSMYNIDFDYSSPGQVNVSFNDNPTVRYSYADGYLTEAIYFDAAGNTAGKFTVERSGTTINRVIVEHIDRLTVVSTKDTMVISFSGTSGNTVMTANGKYFTGTPVTVEYVYQDSLIREIRGGEFGNASVFLPSYQFTYDDMKRLSLKTSDTYYGTAYTYGDAGSGLDSLYLVLGGRDGYLLDGLLFHDEYLSVFFYPLRLILDDTGIELDALVHRYGALREVRTVPFGPDYPEIRVFTSQNTFNNDKQLVSSRITRGTDFFASYTINY